MKLTGKIEKRDLEGGVWQLAADNGARYTLIGSAKDFTAGARVEVEGTVDEGGFGLAMSGPQLRVKSVKKL